MKPVLKTYQILAWKCLNRSVNEDWSNWAVDMMMVGYDTEHLIELAGISKPFNQFELKELTDKVFQELNLDTSEEERIILNYASYLINQVKDTKDIESTLSVLKDLCIELDYNDRLYDFYSLYFAKEDLKYSEIQYYWNDATRENIDQICMEYFKRWNNENPLNDFE